MLYVFHVDSGRMIKFDMNVALTSVQNLKEIIERTHGLPAGNIVLLISGGEMLVPNSLVCSYSAGTDTNPIYMFSTVDFKPQPWPSIEPAHFSDEDLSAQVERSLSLPPTYSTVVTRAQLAQQLYDLAREEDTICETLVHEQHLQQQGWSAVVANMEDLTEEFSQRFQNFSQYFSEHLNKREQHLKLLQHFSDDIVNLSKIPILPGLLENAEEEFHGFDSFLENDVFSTSHQAESVIMKNCDDLKNNSKKSDSNNSKSNTSSKDIQMESSSGCAGLIEEKRPRLSKETTPEKRVPSVGTDSSNRNLTLLQWITAKDTHSALKTMADECIQGLETFTTEKFEKLKQEILNIIKLAEQDDIKEIKGLEDRLSGLEKLMFSLRKFVQDQKELSTAFQQNQHRASNLGDASILPDLCASHRSQLLVMLNHHKQIRDYRRRISKAKDELGANLYKRLKYIVHIENTMSELDNSLLFYHRCQHRVERHLNIIYQIHQTPIMYVAAVTEVVRRRIFSGEFVRWASTLACDFDAIHTEEVVRRRKFNEHFQGHFLNTLFPGMNDMPPAFANENPLVFDSSLPNITKSDLDILNTYLPEISDKIQLPDMKTVIEFFSLRSGKAIDSKLLISSTQQKLIASQRPIEFFSHLKDEFESETDTEEFEKVGAQSTSEKNGPQLEEKIEKKFVNTSTSFGQLLEKFTVAIGTEPIETNTVETCTDDASNSEQEIEELKTILKNVSQVIQKSLELFRNNLDTIKSDYQNSKEDVNVQINKLYEKLQECQKQYDARSKNEIEQLQQTHESELNQLKSTLHSKNVQLDTLKIEHNSCESAHYNEIEQYEKKLKELRDQCIDLESKINLTNKNHTAALNDLRDKLKNEHKTEIESLRCRFKLMTSMERSPSDSSLEKIEKPLDMIDMSYHESIIMQTKEDCNTEKEKAIREAVETEKLKWEATVSKNLSEPNSAIASNMELLKKMIEEKDKQLDMMRDRDLSLSKENCQLKMRIETLLNDEVSDKDWLKEKIEYLNRDKQRLQQELNSEKVRRIEMESSVATMKGSMNESTIIGRHRFTSSQLVQGNCGAHRFCIFTDSCNKGDIVFATWSIRHQQFIVIQDSQTLYFVHADSLTSLNLNLPLTGDSAIPVPFFAIGRVMHKEFCQARKDENRYKVPKGGKFYRVHLSPIDEFRFFNKRERFDVNRATNQYLMDSFCQTDQPDYTDSPTVSNAAASEATVSHPASSEATVFEANISEELPYPMLSSSMTSNSSPREMFESAVSLKERTISVNSGTEEEADVSLLSDRGHKISLSEEDETFITEPQISTSTVID